MFDKFGEFDSWEEINRAAAAQKEEGDFEALKEIAKENGIDEEDAQDYIDGVVDELCNTSMAAIGKINIEKKALGLTEIMADWADYIIKESIEDEKMARELLKARKGEEAKMRPNDYLCKVVNENFGLKGYCVKVIRN